jgi:hypothetical protein
MSNDVASGRQGDRQYRVYLSVCIVSFLFWLLDSYALSNVIRSVCRLTGKLLGR